MPLLEVLAIDVGASIAKAILKRWLGDAGPITDAASSIVDVLKTRTADRLAQRRAERQFEAIGEKVGESLLPLFEVEGAILAENERMAVARAVADTLNAATSEVIAQQNFEPAEVAKQLLLTHPAKSYFFSEAEGHLYERIIKESCEYIVDIASQLPHFTERTLAEILQREGQLITITEKILEEVARMRADLDPQLESARFELDYRRAVVRHLDELELFGSGMSITRRKYSLSLAYVTLSLEHTEHSMHPPKKRGMKDDFPFEREASAATVRRITSVNEVLADAHAVLIRGEAGSGKTTLLQWIAVQSASRTFPQPLHTWNGTIPFYIRLRQHAPGDASTPPVWPAPEAFPGLLAPAIAGAMPRGWVHQQLQNGHAIILVDGVDEVPASQRESVYAWLKDLMLTYDQVRFVITSRPYAIGEGFPAERFKDALLLPMELPDIETFIDQWHTAMITNTQEDEERTQLRSAATQLKEEMRRNHSQRLLATNPLLCAMLCALNQERHQQLPSDHIALYEACCELLIERRDVERRISLAQYPAAALSYAQKSLLLADLAYWFVRNGWTEAALESVDERFTWRLARIPGIQQKINGANTRQLFIERSGMLREPIAGAIDFAHRTFQEFLAAKAVIDEGDIGVLVQHAHDDQWREVVLLAAGQASKKALEDLIERLIGRGETEKGYRSQLYLLAAACAQASHEEVGMNTKLRIERRLKALVPLKSVKEVEALAAARELALPYLSPRLQYTANMAAACVRALTRIGGEAAIKILAAYTNDFTPAVLEALVAGLRDSDDKQAYADLLLKHITNLRLTSSLPLEYLQYIPNLTSLTLGNLPGVSDLSVLGQLPNLTSLTLEYLPAGSDLSVLSGRLPNLTSLTLGNIQGVSDLSVLGQLPITISLTLWDPPEVSDSRVLGQLPNLISLTLWDLPKGSDLSVLGQLPNLTSLVLRYLPAGSDLSVLGQLPNLTSLTLEHLPAGSDLSVPPRLTRLIRML